MPADQRLCCQNHEFDTFLYCKPIQIELSACPIGNLFLHAIQMIDEIISGDTYARFSPIINCPYHRHVVKRRLCVTEYGFNSTRSEEAATTTSYADVTTDVETLSTLQLQIDEFSRRLPPPPTMPPPPPTPTPDEFTVDTARCNFSILRSLCGIDSVKLHLRDERMDGQTPGIELCAF